jgi:hypothetical protein
MFQGDYRTGTKASTFEFDGALTPQQPQDIPRDGVCENIRAGNPAAAMCVSRTLSVTVSQQSQRDSQTTASI